MKTKLRNVTLYIAKILGTVLFDRKYLSGKWFENINSGGWRWVWRSLIWQKILGFNRNIPWPVSPFIVIARPDNISFHNEDLQIFQTYGTYFQNFSGKIKIGRGTYIAPNVGIITTNHDPLNPDNHLESKDVEIGERCWIGMNSVILPGVKIGNNTVIGAGSVVTKSFPEGNCLIAGNPGRIIKYYRREEYNGN